MSKALVLMNTQYAYLMQKGRLYLGSSVDAYKSSLESSISWAKDNGWLVFCVVEVRSPEDEYFRNQKSACFVGSEDIRIPDYIGLACGDRLIKSSRPDAVHVSPLAGLLKRAGAEVVAVCGVETQTAVMLTAHSLKSGYFPTEVKVVEPLCLSRDSYLHGAAVSIMANSLGLEIVDELRSL